MVKRGRGWGPPSRNRWYRYAGALTPYLASRLYNSGKNAVSTRVRRVYRSKLPSRQFGAKRLRTYRRRPRKYQRKTRRLARLTGYGTKTFETIISQDVTKMTISVDKQQFHFLPTSNGSNGINTKERKDIVLPKLETYFGNVADKDQRYIIKNQTSKIVFKNQSNFQNKIRLLVVKCIRDVPDEEGALQTLLGKGFLDYGLSDSAEHLVGITLAQCPRFWRYFKIASQTTFYLDPGAQREKTIRSNYPQDWSKRYSNTTSYVELAGSLRFMLIVEGGLGHDTTTAGNIGFSNSVLDVFMTGTTRGTVANLSAPGASMAISGLVAPAVVEGFVNAEADKEITET